MIGAQVLAYLTFNVALTRWPGSRVYPWAFLAPVVAILIEAFRGHLPGALPTVGMAVVVVSVIADRRTSPAAPRRLAQTSTSPKTPAAASRSTSASA